MCNADTEGVSEGLRYKMSDDTSPMKALFASAVMDIHVSTYSLTTISCSLEISHLSSG